MNEEELRKLMQNGFEKLKPHIEGMTIAMMECYQQGFKDCWKVLTGKDFLSMKELTIEQKAKAYDEAIKKLRNLYRDYDTVSLLIDVKEELANLFPELKESEESEDEKIRKWLIALIKSNEYGSISKVGEMPCSKLNVLAWLERQGEQKSVDKLQVSGELYEHIRNTCACIDDALSSETLADINDYLSMAGRSAKSAFDMIEKQGEQKPADKIEPKFKQGDTIREKETGNLFYVNSIEDFGYTLHYSNRTTICCTMSFKYEDDYELVEQNPTWSEEDEKMLEYALDMIEWYSGKNEDKSRLVSNWLKSLKDRVQPQHEWSEEDEEMLRRCFSATFGHGYLKECDWLKSIKDRVHPQQQEWSEEDEKLQSTLIRWQEEWLSSQKNGGYMDNENLIKSIEKSIFWLHHIKDRIQLQNLTVTDTELAKAKKDAYNDALDKIEYHSSEPTFDDGWSAAINYIRKKSFRPQSNWKPTEEQMEALWSATEKYLESDNENVRKLRGEVLESLYNDLKKLKS